MGVGDICGGYSMCEVGGVCMDLWVEQARIIEGLMGKAVSEKQVGLLKKLGGGEKCSRWGSQHWLSLCSSTRVNPGI